MMERAAPCLEISDLSLCVGRIIAPDPPTKRSAMRWSAPGGD